MRVFYWMAAVSLCATLAVPASAQIPACSAPLWSPCELTFALQAGEDPAGAQLRAEFRSPHKDTLVLRAFREGNTLILRFTPDEAGEWDFRITSNLKRFDGQIGRTTGTASMAPGFVRTVNVHHFQTANLQPHLWMASAIDNFVAMARADFEAAVAARVAEKFTHLRVVLEASADLKEAADRVAFIHARGIVTDVALATIPEDRRERERYITDLVARFASYNITWAGVPAFEKLKNSKVLLRETGALLMQLDAYKHPRTSMAEVSSAPLLVEPPDARWMNIVSYGTADPNVGAVEHELYSVPGINAGIRTRSDLWNATMNGQYPASGSGKEFTVWFDFLSRTRHWELEPYYDVNGGRAIALRDQDYGGEHYDAVEYIVYVEKPGPVELVVEDRGYDVAWLNPATGDRVEAKGYKGKRFTGEPPDKSHDWVLHVSREGRKEGMLKTYKFESRRVLMQQVESNPTAVPFEIESPAGDIPMRVPALYSLKIVRPTRATRDLLMEWTAELATGTEGGRVVGTGKDGTFRLPESFGARVPAVISMRAAILNANGKLYVIDRAFRLVP
ncbi:MAG: DUF5060 domain-containing protein [Acidobacteriota bacterium]